MCSFAAHGMDECLMVTDGSSFVEDLESLVSWNGFNNLYDGFQVYWKIETSASDYASRHRDFTQWVRLWGDRMGSGIDTGLFHLCIVGWRESYKSQFEILYLYDSR